MEYKSNNNIVYSCKYHVVRFPKYRQKVLVGEIEIRLEEIIKDVRKENGVEIIEMEIIPDHVHLYPRMMNHSIVTSYNGGFMPAVAMLE